MPYQKNKFIIKNIIALHAVLLIMALFLIPGIPACIGMNAHVKGIDSGFSPMTTERYEIVEPVEIEASTFRLFWFIPVTPGMKINETISDTISKKGGDNLIEMQLWHERQYWILGTVDIVHIKGKIVRYTD